MPDRHAALLAATWNCWEAARRVSDAVLDGPLSGESAQAHHHRIADLLALKRTTHEQFVSTLAELGFNEQ